MTRTALLAALLLVAAAPPQEFPQRKCCDSKRPRPWPDYNRKGVKWTQPMDAAVKKARETNRLLMVFQLVGDMDKEGC